MALGYAKTAKGGEPISSIPGIGYTDGASCRGSYPKAYLFYGWFSKYYKVTLADGKTYNVRVGDVNLSPWRVCADGPLV